MKKLLATVAIAAASVAGLAATAGAASADTITSGPVIGSSSIVVDDDTIGTTLVDPSDPGTSVVVAIDHDHDAEFLTRVADGRIPTGWRVHPTQPGPLASQWDTLSAIVMFKAPYPMP